MAEFIGTHMSLGRSAWTTCTAAKDVGIFCDDPVPDGAPVSMCGKHLIAAFRFCEDALDARRGQLSDAESDHFQRYTELRMRRVRVVNDEVVYYALIDGLVKIGKTFQLKERMRSLRADAVLATELGGFELENLRHAQFAHLRAPIARQRELFIPGDDLIAHVEALRQVSMAAAPT
jgi:hypothetical protein